MSLIAHWPLDGNANDISGNGYHGTESSVVYAEGKIGQCFENDIGTTRSVGIPNTPALTHNQTIAMWLYPTSNASRRNPWNQNYGGEGTITHEPSGEFNYYWGTNGGNASPYQGVGSGFSIDLNTWSHITLVRDLDKMQIRWYKNGDLIRTVAASYTAAAASVNNITIGNGYTSHYDGRINDVRLYNHALSDKEVKEISQAKLIHYKFDHPSEEATVNLLPNTEINGNPEAGNTHGTYNTNNYNSNNDYSIGTMGSVSNNIVTLATIGRVINDFDVLNAGSTGGGVTAGTQYLIKKHSSNSFSLHAYSNSQDGSQGYINPETGKPKIHDSYYKDERIPISESGFPLMWHGNAHQPNSHLVKELIPNQYNGENFKGHSFIRCHTEHIIDGGTDGMAYGVYPSVVGGEQYSFSFFYRAAPGSQLNATIRLGLHTTTGWTGDDITVSITDYNWHKYSFTATAPASGGTNMYFWFTKGTTIDISEIQCEHKDHITQYSKGTREGAIIRDSSAFNKKASVSASTAPVYSTGHIGRGAMSFNQQYISLNDDLGYRDEVSVFAWFKSSGAPGDSFHIVCGGAQLEISIHTAGYLRTGLYVNGSRQVHNHGSGLLDGNWHQVGFTYDGNIKRAYIDGKEVGNNTLGGPLTNYSFSNRRIGTFGTATNYYANGDIDDYRVYATALSAEDVANLYREKSSSIKTISSASGSISIGAGANKINLVTKK